jgi:hypothetical protein
MQHQSALGLRTRPRRVRFTASRGAPGRPYRISRCTAICLTEDGYYTKTIRFFDNNYQLAQNEDKTAIFDNWCDFLNYFDSSIHVQLTFNNQHVDFTEHQRMIDLPAGNDNYDAIREEYTRMLRDQLSKGTNGLEKSKYITFGIQAKNLKEAKARLDTPDMLDFATAIPLSGFRFLLHMKILRGRENFRIYAFPIA